MFVSSIGSRDHVGDAHEILASSRLVLDIERKLIQYGTCSVQFCIWLGEGPEVDQSSTIRSQGKMFVGQVEVEMTYPIEDGV